jgi:hypothetical protein
MIIPFNTPRYFTIPDGPMTGTNVLVKEAPDNLLVAATAQDLANSTPGDPYNCMFAVAVKRMYDAVWVAVEHGVCGAVMTDEDGKLVFHRWILGSKAKVNAKDFDGGKKFSPHMVKFLKPSPSRTLAAQALAHVKWELKQAREKRAGIKKEKSAPSKPRRRAHVKGNKQSLSADQLAEVAVVATLRKSGKGMFQFRPVAK